VADGEVDWVSNLAKLTFPRDNLVIDSKVSLNITLVCIGVALRLRAAMAAQKLLLSLVTVGE